MARSKIVIADEPTVALDGPTAQSVMELLRAYVSPTTGVLLVTHDHRIIRSSDRRIELAFWNQHKIILY
jgi:ABC-type lipoprotein export system ATPase subunit